MSSQSPGEIVNVFVIHRLEWLVCLLIQTHIQLKCNVVCAGVDRVQVDTGRMCRPFSLPKLRQQSFQSLLVLGGDDRDGWFQRLAGLTKKIAEDTPNHFELISGTTPLELVGVGDHDEVGAAHLDPGWMAFGCRSTLKRSEQNKN